MNIQLKFFLLLFFLNATFSEFVTIVPDPNKYISKNISNSYLGFNFKKIKNFKRNLEKRKRRNVEKRRKNIQL
jgi:hypothetical protein